MPSRTGRAINGAHSGLGGNLEDLENALEAPPRERRPKVNSVTDEICQAAYENGVSREHLEYLIDLLSRPSRLDQASAGRLIKNLYPAERVPDGIVFKIVGCLGQGESKPSAQIQSSLLKWLLLVHDHIEDPLLLSSLYGVLFNLLENITLRPLLCQILALITRRKHVRPFRIQMLLELQHNVGDEPPLIGLVRVYKDYHPDVVVSDGFPGRRSYFTPPDPEWRKHLEVILSANTANSDIQKQGVSAFRVFRNHSGKAKVSTIPEAHTLQPEDNHTSLEEIDNAADFVKNLEKIEMPNQAVSALRDPLLQTYLSLCPSDSAKERIENWLSAFLEEELSTLREGHSTNDGLAEVLQGVAIYLRRSKILTSSCERFLRSYLLDWDGISNRESILEIASYLPIRPFIELQSTHLNNLEAAILENTSASQIILLEFYTTLTYNWGARILASSDFPSSDASSSSKRQTKALASLTNHVSTLCLALLESSANLPAPVTSTSPILHFYETFTTLLSHSSPDPPLIQITTPTSELIYLLTFTSSLGTLSRLCSVLASYKDAFSRALAHSGKGLSQQYPRPYINAFNGHMMDLCNLLWRDRAFNTTDTSAHGCLTPQFLVKELTSYVQQQGYQLGSLFNLSHAPAFIEISADCLKEMLGSEQVKDALSLGPASAMTLNTLAENSGGAVDISFTEYRKEMLRCLETLRTSDSGAKVEFGDGEGRLLGIGELMRCTVKELR
ncbi:MAG: hypothetical protein M4579_003627 [Chaenotheca gracillima]|nr:MAG: hypothetical protein M4579_003627 [Chaenotheca gracillima]